MSRMTPGSDTPVKRSRRRLVLPALVVVALAVAAMVVALATAKPASSVPSNGQPCGRCHDQTQTTTITLRVSTTTAKPGDVVRLSGKLGAGRDDQKITMFKRRGTNAWRVWKRVVLTSTLTYSARWTAPTTKGTYSFKARYPGDNTYKGVTSLVRKVTVK